MSVCPLLLLPKVTCQRLPDIHDDSLSVKFNDGDLLGIHLRLTLSQRTLRSRNIEAKWRTDKGAQLLLLENLAAQVNRLLGESLAQ